MTLNQSLAETLRKRQLYLMRHQASFRAEIDKYLGTLGKAISAEIVSISPGEPLRAAYRRQRVDKLIEAVASIIGSSYRDINGFSTRELSGLAQVESLYLLNTINSLLEKNLSNIALDAGEAAVLARSSLITGAPMKDWWDQQSESLQASFAQQMRMGMLGGESDAQLVSRVRGTSGMGFADGIMQVSRRKAYILVRGASSSVVSATRTKAVLDNPNIFSGIQQVSVLDGRTSVICCSYAGKAWELPGYKPIGHSLPYNGGVPRHPNCRSTEIPVIKGESPADDIGFDDFIEGKSPGELDDLLGKGRAQLYRAGKITLSDLVDQHGRPLTLDQLREID
jgi:hypothetical protein